MSKTANKAWSGINDVNGGLRDSKTNLTEEPSRFEALLVFPIGLASHASFTTYGYYFFPSALNPTSSSALPGYLLTPPHSLLYS